MNQRIFNAVLGLSLLSISSLVYAGSFECKISYSAFLANDGSLDENSKAAKKFLNQVFSVDRKSGEISGTIKHLDNFSDEVETKIYDYKPESNGFKIITITEPNNIVFYFEVKEYLKQEKKPFIYKLGPLINTGLCVYK
ncbi:MAG: hypothetical protein OQJ89_00115 [Kangiellaceae bacterium]|nr:hypothetical protein [Kangiellaceae bacterium]MCW9015342.1 hypothetical protein [Kangiellaceae bacterium]